MDNRDQLINSLQQQLSQLEAVLQKRDAEIVRRDQSIAALESRIKELEAELRRRGKRYKSKANTQGKLNQSPDQRRKGQRKHAGVTRPKLDEKKLDFYAAYNKIDCTKQRCLVHLLRELVKLRQEALRLGLWRRIFSR